MERMDPIPGQPEYFFNRVSRRHPMNDDGKLVLAPTLEALTPAERRRVPKPVGELYRTFRERVAGAPGSLTWLAEEIRELAPILEAAVFGRREYWCVRVPRPFGETFDRGCFGCDGVAISQPRAGWPEELRWLATTLGRCDRTAEQSGTIQCRTLDEIAAQDRAMMASLEESTGLPMFDRWDEVRARLPPGAGEWISLYEQDGDWVFADVEHNTTRWIGSEWTGEGETRFELPWRRALNFFLWALLHDGAVRPTALAALAVG